MRAAVLKSSAALGGALCLVLVGVAPQMAKADVASSGCAVAGSATGQTLTCSPAGQPYTWTVPRGVTSINVEVAGGNGGGKSPDHGDNPGGGGADIMGTLAVTPGEELVLAVGGNGEFGGSGGWGYEGMSGGTSNTASESDRDGASGGGASVVGVEQNGTVSRLIVAGGGGGAGGGSSDPVDNGRGGSAGCTGYWYETGYGWSCGSVSLVGSDGWHGTKGPLGGSGGTAGASASGAGLRGLGASGLGGNGGSGGGGVQGGGAGGGARGISAGGGGGAGTSWIDPSVQNATYTSTDAEAGSAATLKSAGILIQY